MKQSKGKRRKKIMVSTRRCGSLSTNSKRSSSKDNNDSKPPSPRCLEGENGGLTKKLIPTVENSKEFSALEEVGPKNAGPESVSTIGGGSRGALILRKGQETAMLEVAAVTPIADDLRQSWWV